MSTLSVPLKMALIEAGTREEVAHLQVRQVPFGDCHYCNRCCICLSYACFVHMCMLHKAAACPTKYLKAWDPPAGQLGVALEREARQHHPSRIYAGAHVGAHCYCKWHV